VIVCLSYRTHMKEKKREARTKEGGKNGREHEPL
jgi:hypothetical protein